MAIKKEQQFPIIISNPELERLWNSLFTDVNERRLKEVHGSVHLSSILFTTDLKTIAEWEVGFQTARDLIQKQEQAIALMKMAISLGAEIIDTTVEDE